MANKIEHPKKRAFLAAYAKVATVRYACKMAKISRTTHYQWMKDDQQYKVAFGDAKLDACDNLEEEASRRAMEGCEEVVYYQGEECGRIRKYSDVLLIVLMKANMPDKYIERRAIEHSGAQPVESLHKPRDIADIRRGIQRDPDYIEFLRTTACQGNGNARPVGGNSKPVLEHGKAPGNGRPGPHGDGTANGSGKH